MPLPQQQLAQLQADLQGHEKRVANLKAMQIDISNELQVHDVILRLGQDPKILALLNELYDQPAQVDQMRSNPNAYLQSKGIQLPAGAAVTASRSTPTGAIVTASYHIGRFQFDAQWDRETGFAVKQVVHQ